MVVSSQSAEEVARDGCITRKNLKLAHLPLSQDQRSVVNNLLNVFKKNGEYDVLRKAVYARFDESQAKANLITSLEHLAEREIEKSSSLLSKERRIAAALIEGAAERSDIYRDVEADVNVLVSKLIDGAETTLRDIRRDIVGEEQALREAERGRKSDADYAVEADERRQCRRLAREEEAKDRAKQETEERERRAEEARRKKEESELRERERKEREERMRAEKEKQYELEKQKERDRKRRYEEEREEERRERRERRYREEEVMRENERARNEFDNRNMPPKGNLHKSEREKDLDEVALELLLKEGQELAAKSKNRSETERPESLEPLSLKSLENGIKRKTTDSISNEKPSKYDNKDQELDDEGASWLQTPARSIARLSQENQLGNTNADGDRGREQGEYNRKGSSVQTQERNEPRNHALSGKSIESGTYSYEREANRRDSNRIRGPAADLRRGSLESPNLNSTDRNNFSRKRQRTRSRSPESMDRYLPGSKRNDGKDRESHNHKYNETPYWSQREDSKQGPYVHRNSIHERYSSKDSRESYDRESREKGRNPSQDRDGGRDYYKSRDGTRRRDRDMDRVRRLSRDRNRDRYTERETNRTGDSERRSSRDQDRDRDRDRHRDREYEKDRERRRYDDYAHIRQRSRDRDQYRKWSR